MIMSEPIEIGIDESLKVNGDPTKLFEELARAQSEFEPVPRQSEGQVGAQRFKYAGYATLIRCVRPALGRHGIALIQPLHHRDDMAITTTIIAGHGASIQSSFAFKAEFVRKQKDGTTVEDPQEFGRHHTYYRRYQLQAMLGIEGDKDADDLPDVNETKTQFSEPAKAPAKESEKAAAVAPKAETKASVAVDKKPAAAQPKTNGSAKPSVATTAPTEPTKPPEVKKADAPVAGSPELALKSINVLLQEGIKSLGWKMSDARAFYKEHVDPAGFESPDNMTIEQKQMLHKKMVEIHDVIPF